MKVLNFDEILSEFGSSQVGTKVPNLEHSTVFFIIYSFTCNCAFAEIVCLNLLDDLITVENILIVAISKIDVTVTF